MLRAALSLVFRSLLFMTAGAALVVAAQLYGPRLLAGVLPDGMQPSPSDTVQMDPQRVMDALGEISGALE